VLLLFQFVQVTSVEGTNAGDFREDVGAERRLERSNDGHAEQDFSCEVNCMTSDEPTKGSVVDLTDGADDEEQVCHQEDH